MAKTIKTTTINQIDDYSGELTGDQSMLISDPESSSTKKVSLTNLKTFFGATSGTEYPEEPDTTPDTTYVYNNGLNSFTNDEYFKTVVENWEFKEEEEEEENTNKQLITDTYTAQIDNEELYIHITVALSSSVAVAVGNAYVGVQIQMKDYNNNHGWVTICRTPIGNIPVANQTLIKSLDYHINLQGGLKIRGIIHKGEMSDKVFIDTSVQNTNLNIVAVTSEPIKDGTETNYLYVRSKTDSDLYDYSFQLTNYYSVELNALGTSKVQNTLSAYIDNKPVGPIINYSTGKQQNKFIGRFYFPANTSNTNIKFKLAVIPTTQVYLKMVKNIVDENEISDISNNTLCSDTSLMIKSCKNFKFNNVALDNTSNGYSKVEIIDDENNHTYAVYDGTTIEAQYGARNLTSYYEDNYMSFTPATNLTAGIEEIRFNGKYTTVPKSAFTNYLNLTKIDFSKSNLLSIGQYAFQNCKSLSSVIFNDKLEIIDQYAFENCKSLSSVHFNDGLKIVKNCAFYNCTSLSSVHFPMSTEHLCAEVFSKCSALVDITIPITIQSINQGLLSTYYSYNLTSTYFINIFNTQKSNGSLNIALPDLTGTEKYNTTSISNLVCNTYSNVLKTLYNISNFRRKISKDEYYGKVVFNIVDSNGEKIVCEDSDKTYSYIGIVGPSNSALSVIPIEEDSLC